MNSFFRTLGIGFISYAVGYLTQSLPIIGGFWIWGWLGGIVVMHFNQSNNQ